MAAPLPGGPIRRTTSPATRRESTFTRRSAKGWLLLERLRRAALRGRMVIGDKHGPLIAGQFPDGGDHLALPRTYTVTRRITRLRGT